MEMSLSLKSFWDTWQKSYNDYSSKTFFRNSCQLISPSVNLLEGKELATPWLIIGFLKNPVIRVIHFLNISTSI